MSASHPIPGLQHRPHSVILRGMVGGSYRDRLVHVGIERDPHLIDPRDARRLERLPHLSLHHVHTVVDRLGVGLCRINVREARQIVERIHQALYQIGLRPLPQLRPLLDGAFLEIVVLGGEPQIPVLHLRQLSLETDDRLVRRLDQRPGFRAGRLLGWLRWLWLVVHGLALHEQSVCRPKCAVLAGPRSCPSPEAAIRQEHSREAWSCRASGSGRYNWLARKPRTSPNAVSRCGSCNTS